MTVGMINANPVVHERPERASHPHAADVLDPLDVFGGLSWCVASDTVRDIKDPEHPYSLEQLSVLSEESVSVDETLGRIQCVCCILSSYSPRHSFLCTCWGMSTGVTRITFTPTVQHCSMATVIGLCLRLKLMQNFPPHFKVLILLCSVFLEILVMVDIKVAPGSLANEESGVYSDKFLRLISKK
ncbi:Protein AE7-like 1 [Zea mays]|uniref:Protein AE7-like 1 n=1 Tax=Zea mays TaxID=4577 RepID=A0A317YBH8_MAIZE|nr:Protein AE7-like 1 [Zea mays]